MSENKNNPYDSDQDIEDIISSAIKAKKDRKNNPAADEETDSVTEEAADAPDEPSDDVVLPKRKFAAVDSEDVPDRMSGDDDEDDDSEPSSDDADDDTDEEEEKEKPRSGKKGKRKKKKWTKKEKTFMVIGVLFLVLCLLGLAAFLIFHYYYGLLHGKWDESTTSEAPVVSADDSTQSDTFDPMTEEEKIKKQLEDIQINPMKDSDVFNILLIGQDLRSYENEERGNTDVMMMLSLNHKLETITLTSFMRDVWLYIPQLDVSDRLNRAFYAGGPEYLRFTLEAYFGVSIDRYVVVDFNQFIDVVDALGGLDLYVTPDEANGYEGEDPDGDNTRGMQNPLDEQNRILGNPKGTDYIKMSYDIEGETLHLNGNQALAYARIRHVGNVDFDRTKRQRIVINEIIKKAKNASLVQLNDLAHKVLPKVSTNIEEEEAAFLVLNILNYLDYEVQEFRVPEDYTFSGHWIDGKSVILCNTVKNAMDLQELIYGKTTVSEEDLKKFADKNVYYDDNGNYIDYNNNIVNF